MFPQPFFIFIFFFIFLPDGCNLCIYCFGRFFIFFYALFVSLFLSKMRAHTLLAAAQTATLVENACTSGFLFYTYIYYFIYFFLRPHSGLFKIFFSAQDPDLRQKPNQFWPWSLAAYNNFSLSVSSSLSLVLSLAPSFICLLRCGPPYAYAPSLLNQNPLKIKIKIVKKNRTLASPPRVRRCRTRRGPWTGTDFAHCRAELFYDFTR